jgi:beta-lactamase regulating signal transducer with metallopeptidase domain
MTALQLAAIFAALADAALKGTVILLAALAATRLMRRRSAASRHLVWVVALASMLALPLVTRTLPAWRVVPIPAPLRPASEFVAAPAASASPALHSPASAASPSSAAQLPATAANPSAGSPSAATPSIGAPARGEHSATASREAAAGRVGPASPSPETPFDWRRVMMVLWAAGGVLLVLRLGYGITRVWWMERRAVEITDEGWVRIADSLARRLRVGRLVTLLREAHAVVPMTWGVMRPVVLLPADAEGWSEERRTVVLAHELAHVRRWDPLTQWIAHVSLALFWFHPLVWVAARKMREEREHACDDAVLAIGTRPVDYADHLLDIVRSLGAAEGPAAALAMARRSQFEGRLLAILDGATARGGVSRGLGMAALVVAALAVAPLAALRAATPSAASPVMADATDAASPVSGFATGSSPVASAKEAKDPGMFARIAGHVGQLVQRATGTAAAHDSAPAQAPAPAVSAPVTTVPATQAKGNEKVPELAAQLNVPPAKMLQMLQEGGDYADVIRAAEGISSSSDKASVLLAVIRRGDVGVADQALLLRAAGTIASSTDMSTVLKEFAAHYPLSASVCPRFFAAVRNIASSTDKRNVLSAVLAQPRLRPETVSSVITASFDLPSSTDRRAVLTEVLRGRSLGADQLAAVVASADSLPSSTDQRAVLTDVLNHGSLPRDVVIAVIRAAGNLPSSTDQRAVLTAVASSQRVDGAVRDAYLAAAARVGSSSDRAAVLNAVLGPSDGRGAAAHETGSSSGTITRDGLWTSDVEFTTDDGRHVIVQTKDVLRGPGSADIREIKPGGFLRAQETREGVTRRVEMLPAGGTIQTRYTVNGRERPFEGEGRRWFADLLSRYTPKS